ncbi:conserved exported hypothetical protein [Alteromonas sp. 38]|uniref:hypothetical protein n=1 Tax=Alteromonas TaxID=226 RepID=UPI0012F15DA4|nr:MULTISPECIES: hypothetical protein [Alteromonas]CAD5261977.1 conserved exported hypothetical protein [Alteromonas sp. 154]VXC26349.1 conserved exported hypothetical protein [Alteromonas sp. 38]
MKNKMKQQLNVLITLLLLSASAPCFSKADSEQVPEKENDIETIEVTAKLKLHQLKYAIKQRSYEFFDVFNKYNDVPEFEVICRYRAPKGSKIKRKECESRYIKAKRTQLIGTAMATGGRLPDEGLVDIQTRVMRIESQMHLRSLIVDNPELKESYNSLKDAMDRYEKHKDASKE